MGRFATGRAKEAEVLLQAGAKYRVDAVKPGHVKLTMLGD